jgi:hypothetical protein
MSFTLIRRKDGKEIPIKVSILDAFRSAPPRRPKAVQPKKVRFLIEGLPSQRLSEHPYMHSPYIYQTLCPAGNKARPLSRSHLTLNRLGLHVGEELKANQFSLHSPITRLLLLLRRMKRVQSLPLRQMPIKTPKMPARINNRPKMTLIRKKKPTRQKTTPR